MFLSHIAENQGMSFPKWDLPGLINQEKFWPGKGQGHHQQAKIKTQDAYQEFEQDAGQDTGQETEQEEGSG